MSDFFEKVNNLFKEIHPLDKVPRAGYLLRGVAQPESVSAHSHFLSLLVLLFCEQYPVRFDKAKALSMAILHDLPEALTMDIPMPVGDAHLKSNKTAMENSIFTTLFDDLPPSIIDVYSEFSIGESTESRLVKGLDKAQMMLKIINYERENNGDLSEFWLNKNNFKSYGIPEVEDFFKKICRFAGYTLPT